MFFDRAKLYVKAGDGGNGVISFRREKYVPLGDFHRVNEELLQVGISATDLRQRVRQGLPIRYQVTDGVAAYIAEHGLYR